MIHYHGLPLAGADTVAAKVLVGRHAFISFKRPDQLAIAVEVCQSFAVDNGAYSYWKAGEALPDPDEYTRGVADIARLPHFDFAVIPDVPDGTTAENDRLISEWRCYFAVRPYVGAPVWHMNEPVGRLQALAKEWPLVCIGSTGTYANVGSFTWWERINLAMEAVCDTRGYPTTKLHGLRMLNPDVFTRVPLASADSTNVARNIGMDTAWRGTYAPASKAARAEVMCGRIEAFNGALSWHPQAAQEPLPLLHCTESE